MKVLAKRNNILGLRHLSTLRWQSKNAEEVAQSDKRTLRSTWDILYNTRQ